MKLTLPRPTAKQLEFMRAQTRYVCYGGARGGGKSFAVREKSAIMALSHPGIRQLILRRTYPELKQNHIDAMQAMLAGVARYRDSDKSLRFPKGSVIFFGYCDSDSDVQRYQGQEYDILYIDEATHFTWEKFEMLNACVRGVNSFPKRTYLTCNPGGVGHAWVKRLFVDREYRNGENPADYTFIRAGLRDNAPLMKADPGYLQRLQSLSPDLRRAWLDGDWDGLAGSFFPEFRREIHVCAPFDIPDWWRLYRALDYGLDALSVVWAAMDGDGNLWIYRHLECGNLVISDAASAIFGAQWEGEEDRICETYMPPDMRSRSRDSGKSQMELFADCGIVGTIASNDRLAGWACVKEWLKPVKAPDGEDTARLKIFDTCGILIKNLPLLEHDSRNPSDAAVEPHDITHACDALRYLCVSHKRPAPSNPMTEEEEYAEKMRKIKERAIAGKRGVRRARFN